MELKYQRRNLAANDLNNQQLTDNFQPVTKKPRFQKNVDSSSPSPYTSTENNFTDEDLQRCLFNKNDIRPISIEQSAVIQQKDCFWCDAGSTEPNFQCPLHKPENTAKKQTNPLPLAVRSLPPEVGLCASSIPGAGYGVCAKRAIPIGAWIGPYEGKFVKPEELPSVADTSYMWEIYKDGKLAGYIDGSDENVSSWMRFIRCARHRGEQNMFAFQYLGKVFYRSFKTILPGQEMLVWYDDKYPQYLGIPSAIFDMGAIIQSGTGSQPDEVIVVSPNETNKPFDTSPQSSFFPSPPPSPVSNPSRHFVSIPVFPKEKHPSTCQTRDEKLSSPMQHSTMEPESYMKSVPKYSYSPLKQNKGNAVTKERRRPKSLESLSLPRDDFSEKTVLVNNSLCKSTSEPSIWTRDHCPPYSTFPQIPVVQKSISAQVAQKPHQCGHCPASFTNVNELRAHSVNHVSKKPFKCGYCTRSFTGATTLNNHIWSHVGGQMFASGKRSFQGEN